jgi:outer membrane lipoprotein-sorting protein
MPRSTSIQSIELRARDRSGFEQVLQSNIYLKRYDNDQSRLLMYFNEPLDVRGARFLIIQHEPRNDMYVYMPGLFKVRKVTSQKVSGSVLGTDFSYEDFERFYGLLTNLDAEQYPDDVLDGRAVYVLNSYPDSSSGYVKIATYIDKETCVPLKIDMFENGNQLRKSLTINPGTIKQAGEIRVPGEMLMRDLRDETQTRLIVQSIQTEVTLDDSLFTPEQMKAAKLPPMPAD